MFRKLCVPLAATLALLLGAAPAQAGSANIYPGQMVTIPRYANAECYPQGGSTPYPTVKWNSWEKVWALYGVEKAHLQFSTGYLYNSTRYTPIWCVWVG